MTVVIPHQRTRDEAAGAIDRAAEDLFAKGAGSTIDIIDPRKEWIDSTMNFSLTGRMGFISVPLSGAVAVDEIHVTVTCELPPMVRNFVGEDKVSRSIEEKIKEIVGA